MTGEVVHLWFVPQTTHAKCVGDGRILVTSLAKSIEAWIMALARIKEKQKELIRSLVKVG
jgi:hypothetical protein